jgi:hypothetical protein
MIGAEIGNFPGARVIDWRSVHRRQQRIDFTRSTFLAKLAHRQIASSIIPQVCVMLEECPESLERLYRGYVFHRRGEEKPGDLSLPPDGVISMG